MKHILLVLVLVSQVLSGSLFGQGSWLDATNVVGNGNITITDMEIDSNGDAYIFGWFDTNIISASGSITSKGGIDIFLLKINNDGNHAWLKGIGSTKADRPGGIEIGSDNAIYISGTINGTIDFDADTSITTNGSDAFLASYKPDGSYSWAKIIGGGPGLQRSEAMEIGNDQIIISGYAKDSIHYDDQHFGYAGKFNHISTFDLNGNYLLHNVIRCKGLGFPTSIASTNDGFIITGFFQDSLFFDIDSLANQSSLPSSDIYMYKTNLNLQGQWVRRTTSTFGENVAYSVRYDGDDELYLVGKTGSLDILIDSTETDQVQVLRTTGSDEYFIFNYKNSTGNLDWYTIGGSNRADGLWDVLIMPDRLISTGYIGGDFYFGNDTLINPVSREILVAEFDLEGNLLHARDAYSEPTRESDQGYRLGITQEGEVLITGVYRSEVINFEDTQFSNISPGDPDIFLATYGCLGGGTVSVTASDLSCYGDYSGEITVTAEGGHTNPHYGHAYDALFDNGDTVINRKFFSPGVLTGFPVGTYDITVHDNANCLIGTASATIEQPDSLMFSYEVAEPGCGGDTAGTIIISNVSGGVAPYQYSINCGADFQADTVFADLDPGDYCIVIEDANGCRTQAIDTTLTGTDPISFEFEIINDSLKCFSDTYGEIHFKNVMGGAGDYMFSIDGGATYQVDTFFMELGGGDYHLVVTDTSSCVSNVIDTLIVSPEPIVFDFAISDTLCFGETGNIIFNTPTGGAGNFRYSIDGGMLFLTDTAFTNLDGGDYQLVVIDDSMCLSLPIDTVLSIPEELVITSVDSIDISTDSDGAIVVEVTGGTEPYEFTLNPSGTTQDSGTFTFVTGEGGVYSIDVSDSNGCGPLSTGNILIEDFTGIAGYNLLEASVYPNPTSGQITIRMAYEEPECQIEVVSLTGQIVSSRKAFTNGGELFEVMDLSHVPSGMYMLRVNGQALKSGIIVK